ncbi:MAG: branched-chain amino acid ABC transporter permease [Oscillospiraceae bacterium]|nr:branched-chain amino acid ABC transporter permease [Oscillospiraceae bacterium]
MSVQLLIQQIFNGLAIGMAYALVAVGFSLVFGILRLINFSHGAVYALGAHLALVFIGLNFGVMPAMLVAVVLSGIAGIIIDKTALQPLRKKNSPPIAILITTVGMARVIQNLLVAFFGSQMRPFPRMFDFGMIEFSGLRIPSTQLVLFLVSMAMMVAITLLIRGTKIGLGMRAVEQNTKASHLMGVNVNYIVSFTFFLAGASAAIASGLIASHYQIVSPQMSAMVGMKAFAAAVLGGVGSLPGAVVGGLIVGVSETLASTLFGDVYSDTTAFIVLFIMLIIRPTGLFGKKEVVKV